MPIDSRLQKLRQSLSDKDIDAIFISQPENRYYLSGFAGSAGYLLITKQKTLLATDFRYLEHVKLQAPNYEIFQTANYMKDWFPELIAGLGSARLGFEAGDITFAMYRQLSTILKEQESPLSLVPVDGMVESLRAVKESEEIELITRAVEISDRAFEHISRSIHEGMTEQEIAWDIEKYLRESGSETIPFDVIVASGPNSALPHARPSQRTVNTGEPVVIDMGARVEGYSSDLSRTICLGTPDDTFKKVYDVVLGAQLTAMAIIKDGMTGEQADNMARTVIEEAGYGEAFGHALGHGIGLAPHELPQMGHGVDELLTPGMVITVEPGIYLPGWGGVRIEDMIIIKNDKAEIITKAGKG